MKTIINNFTFFYDYILLYGMHYHFQKYFLQYQDMYYDHFHQY